MKKLLFITAICSVSLFSACRKENEGVKPQCQKASYDKSNVDAIIKLASPALYIRIHNEKEKVTLVINPGTLVQAPGSTIVKCLPCNSICSIDVVRESVVYKDSTYVVGDTAFTYQKFSNIGDGIIIAVAADMPAAIDVKSLVQKYNTVTQETFIAYETY